MEWSHSFKVTSYSLSNSRIWSLIIKDVLMDIPKRDLLGISQDPISIEQKILILIIGQNVQKLLIFAVFASCIASILKFAKKFSKI